MKKTLAIILSVVMLLGVMPFASFAADSYDRAKVAANDEAYIADMTAEQMASVILDWVDREIAKYSADIKAAVVEGVVENGFEGFEIAAFGDVIAEQIPDIDSLDAVIGYKDYLTELGGDFANLDAAALITRAEAGSAIGFIDGVFEFMAANSETFGKVFRWDEEVFDYGKVGEYILSLDPTVEDNKAIIDFYNNYLIGNDIQAKFTKWVADQMGYAIPEGETFDDTLNNGILGWFSGLCYDATTGEGILSKEAYEELLTYNLKTTDIYTLVKNFVALVQSDNQVKIDTYYNYIMDTVVRSLLKTAMGQQAVVGAEAAVPAGFTATYTDLALLEEISGGKAYYYDGTNYYQVAIVDGVATANALTWDKTIDLENLELPVAKILTGADFSTVVAEYTPTSEEAISVNLYTTQKNQDLMKDALTTSGELIEFAGTEVPADYAALMVADNAKDLVDAFGLEVVMGDETIAELKLTMAEIEELAEAEGLKLANDMLNELKEANEDTVITVPVIGTEISIADELANVKIDSVDVTLTYGGWATADEFICQVTAGATAKISGLSDLAKTGLSLMGIDLEAKIAEIVQNTIDNPVITIVVDGLSGDLNLDDAKALLDFIDTDFVIDESIVDFAGNYDANNGVVGQANNILVKLVNMLAAPAGEAKLNLTAGNNDNFTANLQKICDTVNDVMEAAEDVMNNEDLQGIVDEFGIDLSAILGSLDMDLLYAIDFSSVEALWVSIITMGLDIIDDGSNALISDIHALIGDLTNLDAMAVAVADYALGKCIPDLNKALADAGVDFALTVPSATDAAAVADGAGKNIIMTTLVDLLYEAAVEGVALVNEIANEALATIAAETGIEMPTVAFKLGVEKGADWQATLKGLVDRVYALADGIILACAEQPADTIDAISKVANAILPLGSLASNCASENYAFDGNLVMGFLFDDGLEGDLDGFLRLFETKEKTEDVAADVSVTEALIMASEHIVDAFFPDTVKSELYVDNYATGKFTEITVQEYFTGAENDAVIASNNMDSLNALKADLVPAALNLVREAGVLPFFAKCDKDHSIENLVLAEVKVDSTCSEVGHEAIYKCAECGYTVGGEEIAKKAHTMSAWTQTKAPSCEVKGEEARNCTVCGKNPETRPIAATGHVTWSAWTQTLAPTCEGKGLETRTCTCGKTETRDVAATGHPDADGNKICDVCGHDWNEVDNSFFGKIKAFFQRIIDWFKNLFKF